jgi:hypothetical protein
MPAKPSTAPLAFPTRQIDLAHNAFADPPAVIGINNLADELVSGCSRKTVVTALQLEIGVADSGPQQANERESRSSFRFSSLLNRDAMVLEVYSYHFCARLYIIEIPT